MELQKDNIDLFEDLKDYNTIIAYLVSNQDLLELEREAGSKKVYVNLSVSKKLKDKFLGFYDIKKLPCMIKFGHKVYFDQNYTKNVQISNALEEKHYFDLFKNLVSSSKIFLFIKGDVDSPKCKFTRQLLNILEEKKLVYKRDFLCFDILSDPTFRELLKKFSKWPTYPQIFIKGDILGGLDILKQKIETKEFGSIINNLHQLL